MDQEAVDRFEDLLEADQHDPEIQYQIGLCYLKGDGVEQDGYQAEKWLRRAADQQYEAAVEMLSDPKQENMPLDAEITKENVMTWCLRAENGDVEAQYRVASYFLDDHAVEQLFPGAKDDAVNYLKRAGEQGQPQACFRLGMLMLQRGDQSNAIRLLQNAADCGNLNALELLGECYAKGQGVERDLLQAEQMFIRKAELGGGEEKLELARRYKTGDLIKKNMGHAMSWLKRAEMDGLPEARDRFYTEERAAEASTAEKKKKWEKYRIRAERGESEAQYKIAVRYATGDGAERDDAKAVYWYRLAAEQGYAPAQNALGNCYAYGRGAEQDDAQAFYWYRLAAAQGSAAAQNALGNCYAKGLGTERDKKQALRWYRLAAEQGHIDAQCSMGFCCINGTGMEKDEKQALQWFRWAAAKGSEKAKKVLQQLD